MVRLWKILSSYQGFARSHDKKCTEKFVEHMSKTHTEPMKYEIDNATTGPIISLVFRNFLKHENFHFSKFSIFIMFCFFLNSFVLKRHSTSPSCRNLVDGLPHDCHYSLEE